MPKPDPVIRPGEKLPGLNVEVLAVRGGSGGAGNFQPGDTITVDFRVFDDSNAALELVDMDRGAIMVSGPTFNYQRVIPSQGDLLDGAVRTGIGQYSYTFAMPLPGVYAPPYNDTPSFTDGELTGQPLLSGTYTVGIELRKDYTIGTDTHPDPCNQVAHFLIGSATQIDTREVVRNDNCFQCHNEIRVHGENRTSVEGCVLCHTAGAEDRNNPAVANGTPGASIDFKVMIHKIHTGHALPSVLGVTTNPDGTRKYDATPEPYRLMGFGDRLHDYSEVVMPLWPSIAAPMPRDVGYGLLSSTEKGLEDTMRSGLVSCAACHGDPDGSGPALAPKDGDLAYTQPTRAACASCHDDWVPEHLYRANGTVMPVQRDDSTCKNCHRESGTALDVRDAHLHPLQDPSVAPGIRFEVSAVRELEGNNDGTFDAGEKVQFDLRIVDGQNNVIQPSNVGRMEIVLSGPTTNPNLVHFTSFPLSMLVGGPSYTVRVPETVVLEPVGTSVTSSLGAYATQRTPHWNVPGAETLVFLRTASGNASTLATAANVHQNYIDVQPGQGTRFTSGDTIVIDDAEAGQREFHIVRHVEGDRLWFSSQYSPTISMGGKNVPIATTGLRLFHASGTAVQALTVQLVPNTDYSVDWQTGTIRETSEFGAGEVLVSYTTDFVVPEHYPGTFNETPDLAQKSGDWLGLPLLSGTYKLGVFGDRTVTYVNPNATNHATDDTSYADAAHASISYLRFGDATQVQIIERISSAENCYQCHEDIQFHGNHRRGYDTCLMCHGNAGSEDSAHYVWPAAAPRNSVTIDFRTMLHKIHRGAELANASTYQVHGFRGTPHSYEGVHFPVFHGGTKDCSKCHGENNTAWLLPADRLHPMQTEPTQSWRATCGACHDSNSAKSHIEVNTSSSGGESCAICHGRNEDLPVDTVHTIR